MTQSFITVEDINGALFNNQGFYWHVIDTSLITDARDFTDVKYDFCKVSREEISEGRFKFTLKIDNSYWTTGCHIFYNNDSEGMRIRSPEDGKVVVTLNYPSVKFYLYMGMLPIFFLGNDSVCVLVEEEKKYNLKQLRQLHTLSYRLYRNGSWGTYYVNQMLHQGYNLIKSGSWEYGYVYVKLLKTNFKFNCNQELVAGKVNTVKLGTNSDYKPGGGMIEDNTPTITVLYGDTYIPVTYNDILNDYSFELDLTNKQTEGNVRFNVIIESNDVINDSVTEVILSSHFETINDESKLITLLKTGGIGRLGDNITLSSDLTIDEDVLLLGNGRTLNMNNHKIIVPNNKTFKSNNVKYINGLNTIQQHTGSTVELTECTFTDCTGLGSVIDCQIDIESLEVENDFTTDITECIFTNNDIAIIHGGELNIENCTVNGKIGNPSYPYFLYQTDGNAIILQSEFTLQSETQIESDIEFNSCIFICGETATINGYDHTQLQNNNIIEFLTTQRNLSNINITYYYPIIENYITLESDNGYCHGVSDVDYVFKSKVSLRRN